MNVKNITVFTFFAVFSGISSVTITDIFLVCISNKAHTMYRTGVTVACILSAKNVRKK